MMVMRWIAGSMMAAFVCVLAASAPVSAQENTAAAAPRAQKIGVVDRSKVMAGYTKFQTARTTLEAEMKANNAQLDQREADLKKLKEEYEKSGNTWSADVRSQKQQDAESKVITFRAELNRLQAELNSKSNSLTKTTKDEIETAIREIGQAGSYDLILEGNPESASGVLYFAAGIDITQAVIDKLNNKK